MHSRPQRGRAGMVGSALYGGLCEEPFLERPSGSGRLSHCRLAALALSPRMLRPP